MEFSIGKVNILLFKCAATLFVMVMGALELKAVLSAYLPN